MAKDEMTWAHQQYLWLAGLQSRAPLTWRERLFMSDYEQSFQASFTCRRWVYRGQMYGRWRDEPTERARLLRIRWYCKQPGSWECQHPTEWEWQCPICKRWYHNMQWECQLC